MHQSLVWAAQQMAQAPFPYYDAEYNTFNELAVFYAKLNDSMAAFVAQAPPPDPDPGA
jgi:hypothetical protein